MKSLFIAVMVLVTTLLSEAQEKQNFHSFTVRTIEGEEISLSAFRGKKILVVNTASKCGMTPQYEDLEALYRQYGGEKFVILGFPANNFMNQEPGTNEEILEFCTKNYGVSFPMMEKISVKGKDMHPLYRWLTTKSLNGKMDSKVQWNFQKYLIDESGNLVKMVPPRVKPYDGTIIGWIEGKT